MKAISYLSLFLSLSVAAADGAARHDSLYPFLLDGEDRTCSWVAKAPNTRCALTRPTGGVAKGTVSTHCKATCGVANPKTVDSDMRFAILLTDDANPPNLVYKYKTCKWVNKNNNINNPPCSKCDKTGVKFTCPASCSGC